MARIRTIKPQFWTHEILSSLPEATHLLAAALLNYADDDGHFNANPGLIKAECSPLREPSVSIHDSLIHLSNAGYIQLGSVLDGRRYGRIPKFAEHQVINRPSPSKIKVLEIKWDDSLNPHGILHEPSHPERKGKEGNKEGSKEGKGEGGAKAPTPRAARLPADWKLPDDWKDWAIETRPEIDPKAEAERFADYWHGLGGQKGAKLDWLATWRNWIRGANVSRGNGVVNKQSALEQRNRAVAEQWLENQNGTF